MAAVGIPWNCRRCWPHHRPSDLVASQVHTLTGLTGLSMLCCTRPPVKCGLLGHSGCLLQAEGRDCLFKSQGDVDRIMTGCEERLSWVYRYRTLWPLERRQPGRLLNVFERPKPFGETTAWLLRWSGCSVHCFAHCCANRKIKNRELSPIFGLSCFEFSRRHR